jgi:hypothetical protein
MAVMSNVPPKPATYYFLLTFGYLPHEGQMFRIGLFTAHLKSWPRVEVRLYGETDFLFRPDAQRISKAEFDMYKHLHKYPVLVPYERFSDLTYEVFRVNVAQALSSDGVWKCYSKTEAKKYCGTFRS